MTLAPIVKFTKRLFKEKPLGFVGAIITIILLLVGIFADVIAPYGMNETRLTAPLSSPTATHILGGDQLGRDIFSRIIYGGRISVIVGIASTLVSIIVSVVIGGLSGYFGGKFDLIIQRFVDAWMCFPPLVLLILIMSLIGPGIGKVVVVLGLLTGVSGSRIIRGTVMSVKESVYVESTKAIGSSTTRILLRHVLPNIMAPTVVLFSVRFPGMILSEASASFLGFGVPPPYPSWGGMLSNEARDYMYQAPMMAVWPGIALSIVVYGVNIFGDAVRDLLDPRLKGGAGRFGAKAKKKAKNQPA